MDNKFVELMKPFLLQLVMMLLQALDAYLQKQLPAYKGKKDEGNPGDPPSPPGVSSGTSPIAPPKGTSPGVDAESKPLGREGKRSDSTNHARGFRWGGNWLRRWALAATVLVLTGCGKLPEVNDTGGIKPVPLVESDFPQAVVLGANVSVKVDVVTLNRPTVAIWLTCKTSVIPPGIRCEVK